MGFDPDQQVLQRCPQSAQRVFTECSCAPEPQVLSPPERVSLHLAVQNCTQLGVSEVD